MADSDGSVPGSPNAAAVRAAMDEGVETARDHFGLDVPTLGENRNDAAH